VPSLTPVGQTYAHSRISSLCYCTFNNSASVSLRLPPPVGPTSCAAWRTRSPASLAHIRRALQATCRTPRRLHTPPLHVTRTDPPPPRSAARTWWTPRSVNLLNAQARTRPHQPHMHAMAVVCLGAPACSGVRVTKQRGSVPGLWCVPTGEIPVYLREKPLCTYGRSAVYLREKKHALMLYF